MSELIGTMLLIVAPLLLSQATRESLMPLVDGQPVSSWAADEVRELQANIDEHIEHIETICNSGSSGRRWLRCSQMASTLAR